MRSTAAAGWEVGGRAEPLRAPICHCMADNRLLQRLLPALATPGHRRPARSLAACANCRPCLCCGVVAAPLPLYVDTIAMAHDCGASAALGAAAAMWAAVCASRAAGRRLATLPLSSRPRRPAAGPAGVCSFHFCKKKLFSFCGFTQQYVVFAFFAFSVLFFLPSF
jgi:hypothetical protein